MVKIQIKQVIGKAGTGKTTYAKKIAEHHTKRNKTVYCLALTHNAVENMRRKGFPSKCVFSTMHSFFRIDFTGDVMGSYLPFDVLIIDEFSLISADIMDKCIRSVFKQYINELGDREIYIIGDPLQLGTINADESVKYSVLDKIFHVLPIHDIPVNNIVPITRHWCSLCINSSLVTELTTRSKVLTENHRSESDIMKLVEDIIFNGNLIEILPKLCSTDEVIRYIKNNNYTAISSTYDTLRLINARVRSEENPLTYRDWRYSLNESGYVTVNTDTLYNGEIVKILNADSTSVTIDTANGKTLLTDAFMSNVYGINLNEKIPIVMPTYLYTFHKSQGLEFDNVAICIDNLFEFPMLYTGMTRARKNIVFFTMNSLLYKDIDEISKGSVNSHNLKDIYEKTLSDSALRKSIQSVLANYIKSGVQEIAVIDSIYRECVDK